MEEVSDGEKLDEDSALKKLGFDRKDPNTEKILEKIRKQHEYYRVIYAQANAAVKTKNKGATNVEAVVKGLEDAGAPRLVDKK